MNDKQTLLMLLQYVRDHEGVRSDKRGICDALDSAARALKIKYYGEEILRAQDFLFRKWPEGSGSHVYPIKGILSSPGWAFRKCTNMWSRILPYGRRRWRLLHWMIAQLEKELEHVQ